MTRTRDLQPSRGPTATDRSPTHQAGIVRGLLNAATLIAVPLLAMGSGYAGLVAATGGWVVPSDAWLFLVVAVGRIVPGVMMAELLALWYALGSQDAAVRQRRTLHVLIVAALATPVLAWCCFNAGRQAVAW